MKKWLAFVLALALSLALCAPARAEDAEKAEVRRSAQKLTVNGEAVDCDKYNIDGRNYFKLRDLACLLNGTENQFSVGYENGVVTVTTGAAYTPDGSELAVGEDLSATAVPSAQTVEIDGRERADLSAYNIGGNNYFQLRELGAALRFKVGFAEETNTATVTSLAPGETAAMDTFDYLVFAAKTWGTLVSHEDDDETSDYYRFTYYREENEEDEEYLFYSLQYYPDKDQISLRFFFVQEEALISGGLEWGHDDTIFAGSTSIAQGGKLGVCAYQYDPAADLWELDLISTAMMASVADVDLSLYISQFAPGLVGRSLTMLDLFVLQPDGRGVDSLAPSAG